MLSDARCIILDEATAYADPENEAKIQEALSHLIKDKTLIVVAHRLHTIVGADAIMVWIKAAKFEASSFVKEPDISHPSPEILPCTVRWDIIRLSKVIIIALLSTFPPIV